MQRWFFGSKITLHPSIEWENYRIEEQSRKRVGKMHVWPSYLPPVYSKEKTPSLIIIQSQLLFFRAFLPIKYLKVVFIWSRADLPNQEAEYSSSATPWSAVELGLVSSPITMVGMPKIRPTPMMTNPKAVAPRAWKRIKLLFRKQY